jgi:hypothetical protein
MVLRLPADLVEQLAHDAGLIQTGVSAARPYGWTGLDTDQAWQLEPTSRGRPFPRWST